MNLEFLKWPRKILTFDDDLRRRRIREEMPWFGNDTRVHWLKCDQQFMEAIELLDKRFEVRKNDRGFRLGDRLILEGVIPAGASGTYAVPGISVLVSNYTLPTGHYIECVINYMLEGGQYGIEKDYVVLGITALYSWQRPA